MGRREDRLASQMRLNKTYFRPDPKHPFNTLPVKKEAKIEPEGELDSAPEPK